ncbi:unnamed protein product [Parnassius apollo]|uniref:(apollo) hypothetical protein n=1 Tax=Parnassius apollo TaxID=110799 RepID=A0A8S3W123_PARAO|nr:unnamed protein product [Parnassius apollo]
MESPNAPEQARESCSWSGRMWWRTLLTVGGRASGWAGGQAVPGVAQAQRAVERLVQLQRGHGAAAAGAGSRRLYVRPHCKRASDSLTRGPRFFQTVFSGAGAGRAPPIAAAAHRRPPPPPIHPPPPALIYVPYIKRVFREPLWIFLALYIRLFRPERGLNFSGLRDVLTGIKLL